MGLELRPNCDYCDWDLPPTSLLANGDPDFRLRNVRLRINGFIFLIARMRLLPTSTGLKVFCPKIDDSKSTTAPGAERKYRHGSNPATIGGIPENICSL
jgi:hypothetical protein